MSRAMLIAGIGAAAAAPSYACGAAMYGGPFDASGSDTPYTAPDASYGGPSFDVSRSDVAADVETDVESDDASEDAADDATDSD